MSSGRHLNKNFNFAGTFFLTMLDKMLSMPIEKKIGQLFFIGLPSANPDPVADRLIDEVSPGGICFFARNIKTSAGVRGYLDYLRQNLPIEPFLSLDQEGGLVDRLRRIAEPMPAADSIDTPEQAATMARLTGELIRRLGFNMNFAPVVDVIDESRRDFSNGLFSRALGKSKEETVTLAGHYLAALQETGCIGTFKHFPGLGASEIDSHEDLPEVGITKEILWETDLLPYRALFREQNVHAVMIAHAAYPQLEVQETDAAGLYLPATLSRNMVTGLLREQLGFAGLTITDDLEMGAIVKRYGIGEASLLAIRAGIDMLAICAGADSVSDGYKRIRAAYREGLISEERIDESLKRIARAKSFLDQPLEFDEQRIEELSGEIREFKKQLNK